MERLIQNSNERRMFVNVCGFRYDESKRDALDCRAAIDTKITASHLCWFGRPFSIDTTYINCRAYPTSGSTSGTSRYVLAEHQSVANYIIHHPVLVEEAKGGRQKRILLWSPFVFDPYAGDVLAALYHGAVLCLWDGKQEYQRMEAKEWRSNFLLGCARALQATRATHLCTTPSILNYIAYELQVAEPRELEAKLPDLSVVGVGGEMTSGSMV